MSILLVRLAEYSTLDHSKMPASIVSCSPFLPYYLVSLPLLAVNPFSSLATEFQESLIPFTSKKKIFEGHAVYRLMKSV